MEDAPGPDDDSRVGLLSSNTVAEEETSEKPICFKACQCCEGTARSWTTWAKETTASLNYKRAAMCVAVFWAYVDIGLDGVNGWQLWEAKDYYWASSMISCLFVPNFVTWAFLRANGLASSKDLALLMLQLGPVRELYRSWSTGEHTSNMVWFLVAEGLFEAPFSAILNGYIVTFGSHEKKWTSLVTFYAGFFWSLVTISKAAVRLNFYGQKERSVTALPLEWLWRLPMIAMRISSLVCFGYLMRSTCTMTDDLTESTQIELPAAITLSFGTLLAIIYAVEPSVSFSVCTYFGVAMLFTPPMRFLGIFQRTHNSVFNLRIAETLMLATLAANPRDPNPRVPELWRNAPLMVGTFVVSFGVVVFMRFCDVVYTQCFADSAQVAETLEERAEKVKHQLRTAIKEGDLMMTSLLCKLEGANLADPVVVYEVVVADNRLYDEESTAKLIQMGMPKDAKALREEEDDLDVGDFKAAGFEIQDIIKLDYSIGDLIKANFTFTDLYDAGIKAEQLKDQDFHPEQLLEAGYSTEALKKAGIKTAEAEKKAQSKRLPQLGDEMVVLPGVKFDLNGKHYYKQGDRGRVVKGIEKSDDGKDRFEIIWYRTQLTSTMTTEAWLKNFRFAGTGVQLPVVGDTVQALKEFKLDNKEYYVVGDKGKVTKDSSKGEDQIERFEITWDRTGLVSTMKTEVWFKNLRVLGEKDQNKTEEELLQELEELENKGLDTSNHTPVFGDEMKARPEIELNVGGKNYYKQGDLGRVSKNIYTDEKDGISRFEVSWYRTGLTSTMKTEAWTRNFSFTGSYVAEPSLGMEVQALPGISLVVKDKEYYASGDRGTVSKNKYVDDDSVEKFEVTWVRTGLTSTMKTAFWPKNFMLVE